MERGDGMPVKVGIPRALMYYEYFPMWKTFFEELDVKVVLSDKTTKQLLNDGVSHCVDEACLPVKLFHGHVMNLIGQVDYIFIPRLKSIAKAQYICPKFIGLPEMIKYSIKDLPPIIHTEINLRKSKAQLVHAYKEIGRYFTNSNQRIGAAYRKALDIHEQYIKEIRSGRFPTEIIERKKITARKKELCIALIGHVYNIYDEYVSMNILSKLNDNGIKVITSELIDDQIVQHKVDCLPKKMFWTSGERMLGVVMHLVDRDDIDGIVYLMSFGCGIDAFIADLCEKEVRRKTNIPFALFTLDEHSGEAGFDTRIEAFIDMIRWRKKDESNVSTYG